MPKYKNPACSGFDLGVLVIDWAARKFTVQGIDGGPSMTAKAVLKVFNTHEGNPDVEVSGLILWDNDQLAVHDRGGFLDDVTEDAEACDECKAMIPDSEPELVNKFHARSCSLHPSNVV